MADEPFVWDWFNDKDSYGVRRGTEVVCYTNRLSSGFERAKLIADMLNAAAETVAS